jgi:hypothetical protein
MQVADGKPAEGVGGTGEAEGRHNAYEPTTYDPDDVSDELSSDVVRHAG